MAKILLHGTLHVTVFEAQELSNTSRPSSQAPQFLRKVCPSFLRPALRVLFDREHHCCLNLYRNVDSK
jgi:hypothetical protein